MPSAFSIAAGSYTFPPLITVVILWMSRMFFVGSPSSKGLLDPPPHLWRYFFGSFVACVWRVASGWKRIPLARRLRRFQQ
jgi:hypothetical protein